MLNVEYWSFQPKLLYVRPYGDFGLQPLIFNIRHAHSTPPPQKRKNLVEDGEAWKASPLRALPAGRASIVTYLLYLGRGGGMPL